MKQFAVIFLSSMMLLSVPVFGETVAPAASSASASQIVSTTKRKTKYVGRKSKKVGRRTWNGTKWVYSTTARKTRSPRHKTWKAGRKVVSRTKKVFN